MRFLTTSAMYPALYGNKVENNLFAFGASAYFNGGTQPANAVSFSKKLYYSILDATFKRPYWGTYIKKNCTRRTSSVGPSMATSCEVKVECNCAWRMIR